MEIRIYDTKVKLLEQPTDIPGLLFHPQFRDYDNDADWLPFTRPARQEVSTGNFYSVSELDPPGAILEIGVSRNGKNSFTHAILSKKPDAVPYLGVDVDDKSFLNDGKKRIYTLRTSSMNQERVRAELLTLGIESLGLLLIDGWHSLNAVVNDWRYSDMVVKGGFVVLHDTNGHPPAAFVYAIDPKQYEVRKMFENQDDYGLTICKKL